VAKGEIVINENTCKGCGLCTVFCARGCIVLSKDKLNASGFLLPVFADPDRCNACGVCGWLCPDFAIEVYKYVEKRPGEPVA